MPRFFFHVRRGDVIYEDHEGLEVPSDDIAVLVATEDARTIMREEPDVSPSIQSMEVTDEDGHTLHTVPFVSVGT